MDSAPKVPSEAAGPSRPTGCIRTWTMDAMGLGQSVWIGACQVLAAAFPGTSRSMATIAAGQVAIYCIALGLLMLPLASRLAR